MANIEKSEKTGTLYITLGLLCLNLFMVKYVIMKILSTLKIEGLSVN